MKSAATKFGHGRGVWRLMLIEPRTPAPAVAHTVSLTGAPAIARYAVLGHAKIGFHHIFKIRYFGATTVTVHHRFGAVEGQWRVLESARV